VIRIPSKTFVLGEYLVLQGGPALVLCHPPYFEAERGSSDRPLASQSPAGQLAKKTGFDLSTLAFRDPHQGRGGFGGSGAEFLAVWAYHQGKTSFQEKDCWQAREDYRALASGSGVDVLTQAFGTGEEALLVGVDLAAKKLKNQPLPS
jgi:hypothetical protein